ncbi:MAG: putative colanic acid biosynthesis acetyltransferase WcaF [Patiriisocius sp.]|jgi:putative colanic acid biosynthesis acetyltransferase WcaF
MSETDLSSFDNSWYKPGSRVKIGLWYYVNLLFFKSSWLPISSLKISLLRMFGGNIGANVVIKPAVSIKYPWKLSIGENTWIGENVWIDNLDTVTIGSNCCISQGALLLCGNHNYKKTSFDLSTKPITIENGAWIGAKSIISGGVTVGSHAVLAIGSITNKDLDPYTVYSGSPAQLVRKRIIS